MQAIRDDGSLDPKLDPGLSIDQVVTVYKAMVRTRIIDERLEKLQRQGRIAFHVGSLGEEATIIGVAAALRDADWIVPCYREVGALLWRGYPLQRYVDHMYGNAGDPLHGRQMPDHTFSRAHRRSRTRSVLRWRPRSAASTSASPCSSVMGQRARTTFTRP
jgi:pyruvate dehydrogenase E1 component alpha subunit